MKTFITILLLVLIGYAGHSSTNPKISSDKGSAYSYYNPNTSMMNLDLARYSHPMTSRTLEIQLSRKEKYNKAGNTLLIIGGIATVGGIIMMATADELFYNASTSTNYGSQSEGDLKGAMGVVFTTAGVAGIITGIIFKNKAKKS